MTKQDIVDKLTRQSGIKRREVAYIIDNFLELVVASADKGERIELRGFGSFCRLQKKERKVFSPIAGKSLDVPAKSVLVFKASKATEKQL